MLQTGSRTTSPASERQAASAGAPSVGSSGTGTGPGPRRRGRKPYVGGGAWWWALPAVAGVFIVQYIASFAGGFFAFTDWSGLGGWHVIGLQNFREVFTDSKMVAALGHTLLLAIGYVVLTNGIGLLLALTLNRGLKLRHVLRVLIFMPVVLSPIAVSFVWKYIFQFDGPLNQALRSVGLGSWAHTWLGDPTYAIWTVLVVSVWQNAGMTMVIYLAGLAGVPPELEEAAALDGASLWSRFRFITLPCIQPSVAIGTTLALTGGLRIFDQIMALTNGGPDDATATLSTEIYQQTFVTGRFGYGAALSLAMTVLVVAAAAFQLFLTRSKER